MHLWTIKLSARNVSVNPSNVTEEFRVWWQISYYVTSLVGVEISATTSRKRVYVMSNVQYILPSFSFTAKILNVGTVRSILVLNICKSQSEVNLPSWEHILSFAITGPAGPTAFPLLTSRLTDLLRDQHCDIEICLFLCPGTWYWQWVFISCVYRVI